MKKHTSNELLDEILKYLNSYSNGLVKSIIIDNNATDKKPQEVSEQWYEIGWLYTHRFRVKHNIEQRKDLRSDVDIISHLLSINIHPKTELELALQYLVGRELIIEEPVLDICMYRISYKGKVFIENGGYIGQRKRKRNQELLKYLERVLLALGAIFGTVYGFLEVVKTNEYRNILLSVFLSAVAALLILIIQERRKK